MDLSAYVKYCLGYIRLTRNFRVGKEVDSVFLTEGMLPLEDVRSADLETEPKLLVNLKTFYEYESADVPSNLETPYKEEKRTAKAIQNIYHKHRSDQFTKQVQLRFGYFTIRLPVIAEGSRVEEDEDEEINDAEPRIETREVSFPLFTMTAEIIMDGKELYITPLEPRFEVNISNLERELGENYLDLITILGRLEAEGRFELPQDNDKIFTEVWRHVSGLLGTGGAQFGKDSFHLKDKRLCLVPKANYFLAEDLRKLADTPEEDLCKSAMSCWVSDEGLNYADDLPSDGELYFPFPFDRFQVRAVGRLRNKASMIQGPPGTGKSQTICNLVCHLASQGKRVLFVSQKAQALKVVKDKLKSLKIPNLVAYIPNPGSEALTKQDEEDGAGPQLAKMAAYVQELDRQQSREIPFGSLNNLSKGVFQAKAKLNEQHDLERKIHRIHAELLQLVPYEIPVVDADSFRVGFTAAAWEQWEALAIRIDKVGEDLATLATTASGHLPHWKEKLSVVDFSDGACSLRLQKIRDYLASNRYDRRWRLMRKISNLHFRIKMGSTLKTLPREVLDLVDEITDGPASRAEAAKLFDQLCDEVRQFELTKEYESLLGKFWNDATVVGVTAQVWETLAGLLTSTGQPKQVITENIQRLLTAKASLQELILQKMALIEERGLLGEHFEKRQNLVAGYIKRILDRRLKELWHEGAAFKGLVARLSSDFGKSKKAFKTFDKLRREPAKMKTMIRMMPIWIMELDDASRLLPLERDLFDYVILDEASQCNIAYTMPAMYRAQNAVFVGDTEQMRDSTILFRANLAFETLAAQYDVPMDMQIKPSGSAVQSVMHIAAFRGVTPTFLQFHYRSPWELIEFSNANFYRPKGKELYPLNRRYRTIPPTSLVMQIHEVDGEPDEREESGKENYPEAEGILKLYQRLSALPEYAGLSFGILSFFNIQVQLIQKVFEAAGIKEDGNQLKISVIDGIQGDEKDVIIYSMAVRDSVMAGKRYRPLAGKGGDIQADISAGRVNVAFSRARAQTHCFVSMPVKEFPSTIWIRDYLEHVRDFGEVQIVTGVRPFDSKFEEEVHVMLTAAVRGKTFRVDNQVESCGFRIDLVLTNTATGKALAIECDGPMHFSSESEESYVESDIERQLALEAAGWTFERIRYSDWISNGFDRNSAIRSILSRLTPR